MTRLCLASALFLATTLVGSARAETHPDPRAIVEKAIKAHGGEANLAKFQVAVIKQKGKLLGEGKDQPFTITTWVQGDTRLRMELKQEHMGKTVPLVQVLDGDKGWLRLFDNTQDMRPGQLEEAREALHLFRLTALLPLRDKALTLTPLPEIKLGDRPAVGLRASQKGHRDVTLYFDAKSGLLLRSVRAAKGPLAYGLALPVEETYSDFKEVRGILHPMKATTARDGKPYTDAEVTEVKFRDKVDAAMFAKP